MFDGSINFGVSIEFGRFKYDCEGKELPNSVGIIFSSTSSGPPIYIGFY